MTALRTRILTAMVPATVLALTLAGVGIHRLVRHDLSRSLDRTLLARARGLAGGMDLSVDGSFEFEPGQEAMEEAQAGFYAVFQNEGELFIASPGTPVLTELLWKGEADCLSIDSGAGRARACAVVAKRMPEADEEDMARWHAEHPNQEPPPPTPRRFRVVVGQGTRSLEAALGVVRSRLAGGFLALLGVLAAVVLLSVDRGLAPLQRLSDQADRVGPDSSDVRLDPKAVPTEVQGLVEALNRALDRLVGAYERQKRFTADAAHELRGPVSAIRTQCEVALRRPRNAGELRDTVGTVHGATLRLGNLVERLLQLSKLEAHVGEGNREKVDLAEIAREATTLHQLAAAAKGVALVPDLPTPLPARGDTGQLGECLSNLVANAVRYTSRGGRVTVEPLSGEVPGIRVTDTGLGIPAEHLSRIFDRFYQIDPARSAANGGTGLGLAIARGIARLHGGDITVKSRPEEGSRFELKLPRPDGD